VSSLTRYLEPQFYLAGRDGAEQKSRDAFHHPIPNVRCEGAGGCHEVTVLIHLCKETFCDRFVTFICSTSEEKLTVVVALVLGSDFSRRFDYLAHVAYDGHVLSAREIYALIEKPDD